MQIIPAENLVALLQAAPATRLMATVGSAEDAQLMLGALQVRQALLVSVCQHCFVLPVGVGWRRLLLDALQAHMTPSSFSDHRSAQTASFCAQAQLQRSGRQLSMWPRHLLAAHHLCPWNLPPWSGSHRLA